MSLDSAIRYFRRQQRGLFRCECSIVHPTADPEFDPDTKATTVTVTPVYDGACNVRPRGDVTGRDAQAGERAVRLGDWIGKLPVDTDVAIGDLWTVTAAQYDTYLVGKTFRVADVGFDGWQIARVVGLELATGLELVPDVEVGS